MTDQSDDRHAELLRRSRELRVNATPTERIVWRELRRKHLDGIKFRRQYVIDHFILDFYVPELRLAVELDGETHQGKESYDRAREEYLRSRGIAVIRFEDRNVRENLPAVMETIQAACIARQRDPLWDGWDE